MPECKQCKGTCSLDSRPPYSNCPACNGWGRVEYTKDEIKKMDEGIATVEAEMSKADDN